MIYKDKEVNILGTQYKVIHKNYDEDKDFESSVGYCNVVTKEIVIGKFNTFPDFKEETDDYYLRYYKETVRHEVIHAFLAESGLGDSSLKLATAWPTNEEMVDWIALQFPKIYKVYKELDVM